MSRAKARNPTVGRPSKYNAAFCDRLVEHMAKGLTFESFGAEVGVHRDTLYAWAEKHPAFSDAKKRGVAHSELFYLKLSHSIATGQLRRLSAEEPMVRDGKVVYDADGNMVMRREYAAAHTSAAMVIFLLKNIHRYTDRRDIQHGGQDDGPPIRFSQVMSPEERAATQAEVERLAASRKECGDD